MKNQIISKFFCVFSIVLVLVSCRKEPGWLEPDNWNTHEIIFTTTTPFLMIKVDGDTFTMGLDETHQVTLSTYYIGQTEVTQALWKSVMGSNPSKRKGDNLPVECVSWDDCQEFIHKLNQLTGKNFRLPTEAEWEYAARGGKKSRGYKYSGSNIVGNVAWYHINSDDETHQVATKRANELGIYDMSGNVFEWCQDLYNGVYRVYRGGSYCNTDKWCLSSCRNFGPNGVGYYDVGFRLALSD